MRHKISRTTAIFYMAAIVVSVAAVYYLEATLNQPQPGVYLSFNTLSQQGEGYIDNTFGFPIQINSIYCTVPGGEKLIFGSPNNNILASGTNTFVTIGLTSKTENVPSDCMNWKVGYARYYGTVPSQGSNLSEGTTGNVMLNISNTPK